MSHQKRRGHLKIYLGYAAGVGKTYQMLEDARELKARGVDVVLAFLEPQGRGDLIERSKEFEMVPLLRVACRGSYTEETDVAGILQRRPKVCIVDDLAHTNAPGSERQRRWQDVQALLDGGVNVLTTMNVEARAMARKEQAEPRAEKILVNVTADPSTAMLLRRARRVADYIHAACVAIFVSREKDLSALLAQERQAIERHFRFAENLHIDTAVVQGKNPADTLAEYAHKNGVTQIFVGPASNPPRKWFRGLDFTDQLLYQGRDLEVTVVAERSREGGRPSLYPEDEAAGLMHSGYVRISPEMIVEEAIAEIRRQAGQVEMIYYAYVLDDVQHLLGVISFRELISAERSKKIRDVMRKDYVFVPEDEDKEAVAHLLAKHRLLAVPVVDADKHMMGIVSSADLAGVAQQAASEDILKIGGMEALEGPYMEVTFAQMVRKRAGWLAILFLGEMLTATAMGYFSEEISRAVVLALFIPLIISSGGNSGSQATTLVIRAMALGEIRLRDWWKVIRRELLAGFVLGAILGVIGVTRILLWHGLRGTYGEHYLVIALTIGCSLIGVVMFGTLAGSMLPFILRSCGLDPASASAPFVATLVDVTGLIIYFTVASIILRGILL